MLFNKKQKYDYLFFSVFVSLLFFLLCFLLFSFFIRNFMWWRQANRKDCAMSVSVCGTVLLNICQIILCCKMTKHVSKQQQKHQRNHTKNQICHSQNGICHSVRICLYADCGLCIIFYIFYWKTTNITDLYNRPLKWANHPSSSFHNI